MIGVAALVTFLLAMPAGSKRLTPAQLANGKRCLHYLGHEELTQYQEAVLLTDATRGRASDVDVFLPLFSSWPLRGSINTSISVAVIFFHGASGNANDYFCQGLAAARQQATVPASEVLVLAPWFGNESVSGSRWLPKAPLKDRSASTLWLGPSWMSGGDTAGGRLALPRGLTTSFDAMDALLTNLAASATFPNLRLVTLAGFSAGAQLAQRYAFASPHVPAPDGRAASGSSPYVRVIVGNPSSYLYLDPRRPSASCRPLQDTGADWHCDSYERPSEEENACPEYDNYKYGLQFGDLKNNMYMEKFASAPEGLQLAVANFMKKDVRYLLGTQDTCNCKVRGFQNPEHCMPADDTPWCSPSVTKEGCCDTYPDSATNKLDTACGAMLQGSNRLQRGQLYKSYLRLLFPQHVPVFGYFSGAHNSFPFFSSSAFQAWAYSLDAGEQPVQLLSY